MAEWLMNGELEDAVLASTSICLERMKEPRKNVRTVIDNQTEIRTGHQPNATSLRSFNHYKINNVSLILAKLYQT